MNLRIRSIARLTGVREATLRAWERRYGFPRPLRSENNYRVYSQEEVERVRHAARLMAEGFSASEAIEQVRDGSGTETEVPPQLFERFWKAASALDGDAIELVLAEAQQRLPTLVMCDAFLMPLLARMTERLDVASEHLASSLVRQRLRALLSTVPSAGDGPRAVLACPPLDSHEGGLLGIAIHLKLAGWRISFLGADTPVAALASACEAGAPDIVALSFTRHREPAEVLPLLRELKKACGVPIVVGGSGLREHLALAREAGVFYAESADELLDIHLQLHPKRARARRS